MSYSNHSKGPLKGHTRPPKEAARRSRSNTRCRVLTDLRVAAMAALHGIDYEAPNSILSIKRMFEDMYPWWSVGLVYETFRSPMGGGLYAQWKVLLSPLSRPREGAGRLSPRPL